MRAAALLLALVCTAASAEDAPRRVVLELAPGQALETKAGQVTTEAASCYFNAPACLQNGKRLAAYEARVAALEESQGVPLPVVIGLILGTAAAAFGAGRLLR